MFQVGDRVWVRRSVSSSHAGKVGVIRGRGALFDHVVELSDRRYGFDSHELEHYSEPLNVPGGDDAGEDLPPDPRDDALDRIAERVSSRTLMVHETGKPTTTMWDDIAAILREVGREVSA